MDRDPHEGFIPDLPDDWDQMIDQAGQTRALLVLVLVGGVFGVALVLITGWLAGVL
jgi:hypothetical protein